jgi:hypothetical protein
MSSGWQDLAVLLSFGLGLFTALLGVAAKYAMDYRLGRRQLELGERAAITAALGNGPGLLRRATVRLRDRRVLRRQPADPDAGTHMVVCCKLPRRTGSGHSG